MIANFMFMVSCIADLY